MSLPLTATEAPGRPGVTREPLWLVLALAALLFVARVLAADFGAFVEGDDLSIAAGLAAIRNGNIGDLYRYGPQVGYYQLVVALSKLAGDDLTRIPAIMVWLSCIAGTVIPIAALNAFRHDLSTLERRLLFAVLAANPIVWMSSRYGNTAMVSVAIVLTAAVILSNRPSRRGELLALALFGCAIVVRADAVLATGGIGMLLWRNHGSFRAAAVRVAATGAAVAAIFATLVAVDPRMASLVGNVAEHLANDFPSRFWDYLLWAFSPLVLIFAVLGARELAEGRRWIALSLAAWALPAAAFYYGAITTPRYFLLLAFPLAVAAAVGIAAMLGPPGRRPAWRVALVLLAAGVHLAVALGFTIPSHRRSWLTEGSFVTHDGPMWTGAFLYKSYVMQRPWRASVFSPPLSRVGPADRTLAAMLDTVARGGARGARVLVVLDRAWGSDFQLYSQFAKARVLSMSTGKIPYNKSLELELGGARLTTLGAGELTNDPELRLPLSAGDELWVVIRDGEAEEEVRERLPAALRLAPLPAMPGAPLLTRYRVEGA